MLVHVGADSLIKPHHIATLWFSEFVNDHPNNALKKSFWGAISNWQHQQLSNAIYLNFKAQLDDDLYIPCFLFHDI